ncbi:MAG: hypothetical protein AAGB97_02160 [Dehalococcoidia bacterium]
MSQRSPESRGGGLQTPDSIVVGEKVDVTVRDGLIVIALEF